MTWFLYGGGSGVPSGSTSDVGTTETSTTDNAVVRWDGTTATRVQNSVVTIADSTGNMAGVGTLGCGAITSTGDIVSNGVSTQIALSGAKAIGASPTEAKGLVLKNTTAASLGVESWSPAMYLSGQSWETTGSSSDDVTFRIVNRPTQGADAGGRLQFGYSTNGSGYTEAVSIRSNAVVAFDNNATLLWATDNTGDIGLSAANRPANIYAGTSIEGASKVIGGGLVQISQTTAYVGLSAVAAPAGVSNLSTNRTTVLTSQRTDGSGNIANAVVAAVAAASITADMRVLSAGWTDNAGTPVYAPLMELMGGGGLALDSAKAIGTTAAEATSLVLRNSTAAADGAQQWSPSLFLAGQGWKTDATAASQEVIWRIENQTTQGAANPAGTLVFNNSINGGAYSNRFSVTSSGSVSIGAILSVASQINANGGSNAMLLGHASTGHIKWNTDGGGDIGASGASRPNNIYCKTQFFLGANDSWTGSVLTAWGGGGNIARTNGYASGLEESGFADFIRIVGTTDPFVILHNNKSDAASKDVFGMTWNRGAAEVTNNTTMRLLTVGWTDDADAHWSSFNVRPNGDVYMAGGLTDSTTSTGQNLAIKVQSELTTIAAADTTDTAITIPDGAIVLACSVRVTTVIPTATDFDVGPAGGTVNLFADAVNVAADTTSTGTDALYNNTTGGAVAIRLTMNGTPPGDTTGRVRVTIHYIEVTPPTR